MNNATKPLAVLGAALAFFLVTERSAILPGGDGPGAGVTLSVWAWPTPADTLASLKDEFEQDHPDIRLDIQTVPWSALQQKTLWAIAADSNVPDVVIGSSEWTGALAANGGLDPLDDEFEPAFFDQFFPPTLGVYQFPEISREHAGRRGALRQYGVPLDVDLMMVFYRDDVLSGPMARLGMDRFPESWDGFERLGRALTAETPPGAPSRYLTHLDPGDEVPMRMALMPSSGAETLDATFYKSAFASPAGVEAFGFYKRLLADRIAIPWRRSTNEDPITLYKLDRCFVYVGGPYVTKVLESKLPEQAGRWRAALFPRRTPESPSCGLGGACMALPYNARHRKEAIELMRFMSDTKFAMAYFDKVGSPPPQMAAWDDPVFHQPHPYFGGQKVSEVVRQAIESAMPLQITPSPEVAKGPLRRAMGDVGERGMDPALALKRAAADADRILGRL